METDLAHIREMGEFVRAVRNKRALSREQMATRLRISPKTVKQAELGVYPLGRRPWTIVLELAEGLEALPPLSAATLKFADGLREVASRSAPPSPELQRPTLPSEDMLYRAIRLALDKEALAKAEAAAKISGVDVAFILRGMLDRM